MANQVYTNVGKLTDKKMDMFKFSKHFIFMLNLNSEKKKN